MAITSTDAEQRGSNAGFEQLSLRGVTRAYGKNPPALCDFDLDHRPRRLRGAARPLRVRQVHRPRLSRRPATAHPRLDLARRRAHRHPADREARLRDGVPELRALPAPERAEERRVRSCDAPGSAAAAPGARVGRAAHGATRGARRQTALAAVRRPAAARGDRPRPGHRAGDGADGRTAVQPGRRAARRDAHRDQTHLPGKRVDRPVRHPRPGGGAVAGHTPGRAAQGPPGAERDTAGGVRQPRQRVRRRVHGLPEPLPGAVLASARRAAGDRHRVRHPADRHAGLHRAPDGGSRDDRRDPAGGSGDQPDAEAAAAGAVRVLAEVVEYHGRELSVQARTADGGVLHLKTDRPVVAGSTLALTARPDRVLVYQGGLDRDELAVEAGAAMTGTHAPVRPERGTDAPSVGGARRGLLPAPARPRPPRDRRPFPLPVRLRDRHLLPTAAGRRRTSPTTRASSTTPTRSVPSSRRCGSRCRSPW